MASAAVTVTIDPFTPRDDAVQLDLQLENKRVQPADGQWQHFSRELKTLKEANTVPQLDRAHYASDIQQCAAFPLYLEVPLLSPFFNSSDNAKTCPPETRAFSFVEQLQCHTEVQQQISDFTIASHAASMLSGTLVAALLVYSLLPYVRASNREKCRSSSRATNKGRLSWCSDQSEEFTMPTTRNRASRRMWRSFDGKAIESVKAYRDGLRQRKRQQSQVVNKNAASEAGFELLLAKLPDFNDERGWRDFFDSQIYHDEPQDEVRVRTQIASNIESRSSRVSRDSIAATRAKIRQMKIISKGDRYKSIRDKIDQAATEAAIGDAQSFNEFWHM